MLQVVCIFCLWFNFTLINLLKRREIFVLCVLLNKLCVFFLYLYIFNACISLMKELAIFNSLWLGFFMGVLHAFCCHLNIILVHIYWLLLQQSALKFPTVLSCVLRKPVIWIFIAIQLTGCPMMGDLGVRDLGTD